MGPAARRPQLIGPTLDDQFDPEYLKLNPKAVVPALVHDGRVIVEFTVICEYVDEVFPEPSLKPADLPVERPTKFNQVVNLKIAKQLSITIQPNILYPAIFRLSLMEPY